MFRTGFGLAMGGAVRNPDLGRLVSMVGEIVWSCTLIFDDMLDRAVEREGHPCAHRGFPQTPAPSIWESSDPDWNSSSRAFTAKWPQLKIGRR